jgi:hypothetical protein
MVNGYVLSILVNLQKVVGLLMVNGSVLSILAFLLIVENFSMVNGFAHIPLLQNVKI